MLKLTPIDGGHLMFCDASRNRIKFPADKKIKQIVRGVCEMAEVEVTQRHPISLILRTSPEMSPVERACVLRHMEDYVSRTQFVDG
ncbi:hypothetical protein A3C18_00790 [Candidatus Kaiserbacteria bacterium RIFCSPHIGHO2_02_FULL_54_11b]|uniref:Uncharacterized protein n=1 Tax=Candidatus Kaiserbacteria bacterium RIFCSPHIGHO2_02_FULL_54_11b TaxID=1798494 RepID=A0A1F6DSU7_9BACT|nr:MAG: hypothetical protein A3C18_00790 [Candidatus Kaiserbacteria bacterium RIFCSPHIGHO2_02_FULL_54_11b]